MNKPDWKNAPEWANYLAMDSDGEWYWYEDEPVSNYSETWGSYSGRSEVAFSPYDAWRDSLQTRPE